MKQETYGEPDPQLTDPEHLTKILNSAVEIPVRTFDDLRSKITLLDHPCGFGKTTSLLSVINSQPDLKFLVVVNTLDEVDRIMLGVSQGRMFAPKDALEANANKGDQLEKLLVAKKSVVITHKLYEKAGRLADGGLLRDYSVIIDEVPNTISALPAVKPESMKEIYLDKGFLEMSPTAELRVTQKWIDGYDKFSDTLRSSIFNASLGRGLFYDGKGNLITSIPVSLFDYAGSVTVLTFLSSGSLLTKFLELNGLKYETKTVPGALRAFRERALSLLTIQALPALEKVPYSYSKQKTYTVSSKPARTTATALKNLKQRQLVDIDPGNILLTCSKSAWYKSSRRGDIDVTRPGPFAKNSRLFSKANWIANTTRGTNNYSHCTHLIYLFEQNVNPVLMNWMKVNDAEFRQQYAVTEMIQWIWRSQIRNGLPVTVYMPSKRMRDLLTSWLRLDLSTH